jgi:chromate transport protein ChrA
MFHIPENFSLSYLFSFENLKGFIDWINLAGYAVIFFLMMKFKMHPILTILLGALFGIIFL